MLSLEDKAADTARRRRARGLLCAVYVGVANGSFLVSRYHLVFAWQNPLALPGSVPGIADVGNTLPARARYCSLL